MSVWPGGWLQVRRRVIEEAVSPCLPHLGDIIISGPGLEWSLSDGALFRARYLTMKNI